MPLTTFILAALVQLPPDSAYASDALRRLVAHAAEANRNLPGGLDAFVARVESEVAFVLYSPGDGEVTGQLEQFATDVTWERSGYYGQRVVGHRLLAAGPNVSAATYFPQGWTVPVLYGERLYFDRFDGTPPGVRGRSGIAALHPFAAGRDAVYRFSGGDTIATLQLADRELRIVRIVVEPRTPPDTGRLTGFLGEIHVDADRHQVVRMRGRIVTLSRLRGAGSLLLRTMMDAFAWVDLENAEYEGRWWLPSRQRVELQVGTRAGDSRAVVRIVSQFRQVQVGAPVTREAAARRDSFALTFAPPDTLAAHAGWTETLGSLTSGLQATDFEAVAPSAWRPGGVPAVRWRTDRFGDLVRYNRVEGLYTGLGVRVRPPGAPALEFYATGGWAFAEEVPKGAAAVRWEGGGWQAALRGGRELRHTNDFVAPFEQGLGEPIILLFGRDDFDYVDRRGAGLSVSRQLPRGARLTVDAARYADRPETQRVARGVFGGPALRPNRSVTAGDYTLARLSFERGRAVNATSLQPGVGVRLLAEAARGDLAWERYEAGTQLRRWAGPLLVSARLDAGTVTGDAVPPQQLYELGSMVSLPGYGYKEFGGTTAALGRVTTLLNLGILEAPLRAGKLILPAIAPGLVFQWHAGWTEVRPSAQGALAALGSVETDGIASTVGARVVFFGGTVGLGASRALAAGRRWRFEVTLGGAM